MSRIEGINPFMASLMGLPIHEPIRPHVLCDGCGSKYAIPADEMQSGKGYVPPCWTGERSRTSSSRRDDYCAECSSVFSESHEA